MRVPCVMWGPGRIPTGRVCAELATTMDLYPTFARWAGAETSSDRIIDGRDIRLLMEGRDGAKTPHEVFFYHDGRGRLAAVRAGAWKLHLKKNVEMYNLNDDIGEERNVAENHPEVVKRLRRLAHEFDETLEQQVRPAGQM
jgi:arylsulfatase A-like enzyme